MADPALRVLVVWVLFPSGSRDGIYPSAFPDSRITSFWNQNAVSSQWFSQHVIGQPGPTWDYYLLFPPRAGISAAVLMLAAAGAVGMGAVLAVPTMATAWSGDGPIRQARALGRYIGWTSATLLWLAGAYWLTAIRLF
jgi:hypothetical protein